MKLTKKDFENVVNGRVEMELRETKANRPITYFWAAAFIVCLFLLWAVSTLGGILFFIVSFGAGLWWSRRNFKKAASRIRLALLQEWKGYVEE